MSKQKMTPSKGGRDARLPTGRCTQEQRKRILDAMGDQTFSDWVLSKVARSDIELHRWKICDDTCGYCN